VGPVAVLVSLPLWGSLSDLTGRADRILQLTALTAGVASLGFLMELPVLGLLLLVPVFYSVEYAIEPMLNSAVLLDDQQENRTGAFGRSRLWGSIGFIAGAGAGGIVSEVIGMGYLFPTFLLVMIGLGGSVSGRQKFKSDSLKTSRFVSDLSQLLSDKKMLFMVLFMILWSIPFSGNFMAFSWYWEEIGGSSFGLGLAWGLAAILEAPLYLLSEYYWESVWLEVLLVISPIVAAVRWGLYLLFPIPEILFFVQPLHSLMFVTFSVGSVYMIDRLSTDATRNTGQGLIGASVFGAGAALGNLLAGNLYGLYGPKIYYGSMIGVELTAVAIMILLIFLTTEGGLSSS
jgi:PPP family 3-phenylpropionic acid transporter